jgi:hypothetical protein
VLPALYVAGFILIASVRQFRDPLWAGLPVIILFLLPIAVYTLRRTNYLVSAWTLVIGCLTVELLVAVWGGIPGVAHLLTLSVGTLAFGWIQAVLESLSHAAIVSYSVLEHKFYKGRLAHSPPS